ncbi:MAG: 50S ribosomal protein L11 methyltransferase [Desulfuromonadales bacterium]|nr:50S ribosomal protein L11 methyltransferase [Desulfuromonadales bacterium]
MKNTWVEISCTVPAELTDIVAEYLTNLSGNGVCVENLNIDAFSHSEIPESVTTAVKSYFCATEDSAARLAEIGAFLEGLSQRSPGCVVIPPPELSSVCTEDWSNSWKVNFKPLRVGRRLLIVPSWENVQPRPDDIVLHLDPGMAFGTGGHETTRLCLELLEQIMDNMPTLLTPSVLDLGTGSGILAMAAVQLGAGRVCAVDIDPDAVEVARENLAINGLLEQVECSTTPLDSLSGSFDVILANILAEELVRLAPSLAERLAPGGSLVLSGILAEKEPLVRTGFAHHPLEYVTTLQAGEWVAIHYRKNSRA